MPARSRFRIRLGLGRPIDICVPSNRFVLVVTSLAAVVAGLWAVLAGLDLAGAVRYGVSAGGASFIAWATARELDPDRDLTAALAAVSAPWVVLLGHPALLAGFLWLVAIRALAGTTGTPPYVLDLAAVVGLAALVAAREDGIVAAAGGLGVVAAATLFEAGGRGRTLAAVLVGAGAAAAASLLWGEAVAASTPDRASWWRLGALAVLGAVSMRVSVRANTDRRPRPMSASRIRAARVAAAALVALGVVWHGDEGVYRAAPLALAFGAAAVMSIPRRAGATER